MATIAEYERDEPKYCKKCGKKLERREIPWEYSYKTGKLVKKQVVIECSSKNSSYGHYGVSWIESIDEAESGQRERQPLRTERPEPPKPQEIEKGWRGWGIIGKKKKRNE